MAFPTEIAYGLGADATNGKAVARIYQTKGRPADHPVLVHIHSMQAVSGELCQYLTPEDQILDGGRCAVGVESSIKTPEEVIRLASSKTTTEQARDLNPALRKADEFGLAIVALAQPTGNRIAVAIRDRLSRAANGD